VKKTLPATYNHNPVTTIPTKNRDNITPTQVGTTAYKQKKS